ncbi:MAG: cytochrome C oxidase subunit IV [Rhodobacterales bacterium CG2_30_65_12]|nr:MAG: cytochrome C oxidase subunit IV [Rhodobacterales bacterium CG2_30_65_12]
MAEHQHGSMNIRTQEKTFEGFVKMAARAVITIIVLVVLLAIFNA